MCSNTSGLQGRISRRQLRSWKRPVTAFREPYAEAGNGTTFAVSTLILYLAFVRKYNRRMVREERIQYVDSVETFVDGRIEPDHSWVAMLEDEIQFKQILSYLGPKIQVMVIRRLRRDSWAEIGQAFGISAHNAEVQFANAIKKARSRLLGKGSERTGRAVNPQVPMSPTCARGAFPQAGSGIYRCGGPRLSHRLSKS